MHILEIPSYFPPCGGLFCLDQAQALKAQGHEVRILSNVQLSVRLGWSDYLSLPFGRHEHEMRGVRVMQSYQRGIPKLIRWNVNRWLDIVQQMFADYVARYGRPDILHAHCGKWAGCAAMLISRQTHIPYVVTEHLSVMELASEVGAAPTDAWQVARVRQAYESAACVIPVAEELIDAMAPYYGKNFRWLAVSNTIDTDFFCYQERPSRKGRPFQFACVADFIPRKGYDVLMKAMQQMSSDADIVLTIAGRGTDSSACRELMADSGLSGRVTSMGAIDRDGVRNLLYASDALVLASRSEVQPLVLLEAMSTGIPVVSTECVPCCQRLEACGIVPINDAEALAHAMQSVSRRNYEGASISQQVAALASPEVVGQRLSELFDTIVHTAWQP